MRPISTISDPLFIGHRWHELAARRTFVLISCSRWNATARNDTYAESVDGEKEKEVVD